MIFAKRKKQAEDEKRTWRCADHETVVKRLSRIEGENIAILALLVAVLVFILERA